MCTRGEDAAADAIMSEDVFAAIEPHLHKFRFVHLCGFGEPLMQPNAEELMRRIYEKGCIVSFVTNGILLTRERISRIIAPDKRVKEIAVSIDAAHKDSYEAIRGKGNFDRLIHNLEELRAQREQAAYKPMLTWAFLLMKQNIEELPDAVEMAGRLGFTRIVGKHMETGRTRADLEQALFDTGYVPPPDEQTERRYFEILNEAEQRAREAGVRFIVHPRRLVIDDTCGSQPLRALYIDYAGNVSSCCYLNMLNVRPYMDKEDDDTGVMGNLLETPLPEILERERFEEFISYWSRGELPPVCRGCLLAVRMKLPDTDSRLKSIVSPI